MSTGTQMSPEPNVSNTKDADKEVLIGRIVGGLVLAAAVLFLVVYGVDASLPLLLLASPLLVGAVVAVIGSNQITGKIDSWETGFQRRLEQARSASGKYARWFKRPLYGGLNLWWKATQGIPFFHLRAGLRVTGLLYFGGLMIYLLVTVVYVMVALIVFGLILWIVGKVSGWWDEDKKPTILRTPPIPPAKPRTPIDPVPPLPTIRKSIRREGVTGPYWEHFDRDDNKVAESRLIEGVTGPYIEHTDVHGNKIGETRDIDGVFGRYAEHTDARAEKTAESRAYDGVLQSYTEAVDTHGEKVRESREGGVLTPTIEHEDKRKG